MFEIISFFDKNIKINITDKNDLIQKEIMDKKTWEPNLVKAIYELFNESRTHNKVFIDCGANIGFFSLLCSSLGCSVYSIEMDKLLCKDIKSNFKLNEFKNIKIINKALSNKNDEKLYYAIRKENNRGSQLIVDNITNNLSSSITLDKIIEENKIEEVFLIKIDVEGYEKNVLEGLCKNFGKVKYFIVELAKKIIKEEDVIKIVEIFLEKDYIIYDLQYYNQIKNFDINTFSYKNCQLINNENYKKHINNMYHLTNFLFIQK